MFGLGAGEIFVIAVLALIFIGPKKLPELARGLGRGIKEFQKAKNELLDEVRRDDLDNAKKATLAQKTPPAEDLGHITKAQEAKTQSTSPAQETQA